MSKWEQTEISLKSKPRGCHLVTSEITRQLDGMLSKYRVGLCNIFLQHTSASLTINENADPDVRTDMETFLNDVVPEGRKAPWIHTAEGDDDMPAHAKSSMFGCSLDVPITNGRLNLGTWQGVWLCTETELPSGASSSHAMVTQHGDVATAQYGSSAEEMGSRREGLGITGCSHAASSTKTSHSAAVIPA